MTSRVAALSNPNPGVAPGYVPCVAATPAMADRAAEEVLSQYEPRVADKVRDLWASNVDNEVAVLMRRGAAAMADRARFPLHARIPTNIPYRLSDEQMRIMIDMYPEVRMTFHVSALHDHGPAAAIRHLDWLVMRSEIPPGMRFADFGGNIVKYIEASELDALVVAPNADFKDPSRNQREKMLLRTLVQRYSGAPVGTRESNAAYMAKSVLAGEDRFLVREKLQWFTGQIPVGLMCHVYDVPLADIPYTMERCGIKMMLITLHFSNRFFDTDEGDMPSLGARYRIDRNEDIIEMGFVGSGARWYAHKWSEFQRYGADQILSGKTRRFAYKIIRRRGETITARILEVGGMALPERNQFYRVPDVPCVRVTANLGRKTHGYPQRLDEVFPADVWNRMVREAALDFTRGVGDYHKYVGNYAQITAGHSYNGQDAVLGTVPVERVPILVALSTVSGVATVMRMRAGVRFGTDLELDRREVEGCSLDKLSLKLFYSGLIAALAAPLRPFLAGLEFLEKKTGLEMGKALVQVEPLSQVRQVPADVYYDVVRGKGRIPRDEFPMREHYFDTQVLQEFLHSMAEAKTDEAKVVDVKEPVRDGDIEPSADGSTTVVDQSGGGPPKWLPMPDPDMRYEHDPKAHTRAERVAAIREEIDVVRQEAANDEAWFATRWLEVMAGVEPDRGLLARKVDEWKSLDAWYVNEGVINRSALGKDPNQFRHGGVFCPDDMQVLSADGVTTRTKLRLVEVYMWPAADGAEQRSHKVLSGEPYTGWVLVNDRTLVHNGPLVVAGLLRALQTSMDYELGVYVGGPGAGKTKLIQDRWQPGNMILSPLVKSVDDARSMLVEAHGLSLLQTAKVARTIDSWLCIAGSGRPVPRSSFILSDEVYNGRAARHYAVWGLMRATRVAGYGDPRQIPPIEPSGTVRMYPQLKPMHLVHMYRIWRFGPEVVAMINHHYDFRLRSMRPVGYTEVIWLDKPDSYVPRHDDCAVIGVYQVHKVFGRKLLPNLKHLLATVHESQGRTVDEVCFVELDNRTRPTGDSLNLNEDMCYFCVGATRARKRLVLGNRAKPTLFNKLYPKSQDPRRVAAAADVATAGQSLEFL